MAVAVAVDEEAGPALATVCTLALLLSDRFPWFGGEREESAGATDRLGCNAPLAVSGAARFVRWCAVSLGRCDGEMKGPGAGSADAEGPPPAFAGPPRFTSLSTPHIGSAVFAASSGLLFGYDLGLVQGAIHSIQTHLGYSNLLIEVIVAAAKFGAVFGPFAGGYVMTRYGRRAGLSCGALFYLLGPIAMAAARESLGGIDMILGRFLIGLGIGQCSVVVPAYLGETSPPAWRGFVVELYEVSLVFGMLLSSAVDYALAGSGPNDWRWMVGIPTIPGFLLCVGPILLPESPRWLVMKNREGEALVVLHQIRHAPGAVSNDASTPEVENELLDIWSDVQHVEASVRDVSGAAFRAPSAHPSPAGGGSEDTHTDPPEGDGTNGLNGVGGVVGGAGALDAEPHREGTHLNGSNGRAVAALTEGGKATRRAPGGGGPYASLEVHGGASNGGSGTGRGEPGLWALVRVWTHELFRGQENAAVKVALALAAFNQTTGSTAVTNYAVEVLREMGLTDTKQGILLSSGISLAKLGGVVLSMFLVDGAVGRRPLLIWGGVGMAANMVLLTAGMQIRSIPLVIIAESLYMFSFAVSWAGIFWVLMSEIFSMRVKAVAVSLATSVLFAGGAIANILYHVLLKKGGPLFGIFFAIIAMLSSVYVFVFVPETKGKTLKEVQIMFRDMKTFGFGGAKVKYKPKIEEDRRLMDARNSS